MVIKHTHLILSPFKPCITRCRVSHLELLNINLHVVCHFEEALDMGIIQKDVDHHSPLCRIDEFFENVAISEDIHYNGNKLEAH